MATVVATDAVRDTRPTLIIARRAARDAVSGWIAPGLAVAYALASVLIAFVGLSAGGLVQAQDFGRTSQSLLAVTMWIVPLAAILAGALATSDEGELTLLLAQPVSWSRICLARLAGTAVAIGAAVAFAWGLTGLIVGGLAGWSDFGGYAAVGAVALGSAITGVAIGGLAGAIGVRRGRSLVLALVFWFVAAVAYDLIAIAIVSVLGGDAGWGIGVLAAFNPFDALRVLGTLGIGGEDLAFGPVTAAIQQSETRWLPVVLGAACSVWVAGALVAGTLVFARRDR
jgi:ABC-type transport system involved in multi-copper enzyme maturation permease subunit